MDSSEEMTIMPLGGGQEVGRSCILLQYQGRNVLLDCGCHPGREGSDALPFFDSLDNPADIDLLLITHFHIDHCAALPYFTEKTNFKGRIFMTHATKAVMKLLLSDNIRLQFRSSPLYNEQDLQSCIDKIEVIDYHETVEHRGIKFSCTAAGHVLGAAMFMIDIDGIRVLYTGDYSMEDDRHLISATVPPGGPPDVMIVESTFGITNLPPREKREADFTRTVESIVSRGGSCLVPVFALGRAQELLLILDEHWAQHPELQSIPIFYASRLATKSLRVYQTFINMMNTHVRKLMDQFYNPFKLQHIKSVQNSDFTLLGPCVMMASPGFLQSGVSRQLFESWCTDEKHGVVIAGYTVEGTLAHDLLSHPTEIKCLDNRIKPCRCQIEHISFSAHVDYTQNKSFIKAVQPDYLILVHGEKNQMKRLKDALENEIRRKQWPNRHPPSIAMPENGVKVKLRFRKTIKADVVGSAAVELLEQLEDDNLDGQMSFENVEKKKNSAILPSTAMLITENFDSKLMVAREISSYSSCKFGTITERLKIPLPSGYSLLLQVEDSKNGESVEKRLLDLLMEQLLSIFDDVELKPIPGVGKTENQVINKIIVQNMVFLFLGYTQASGLTHYSLDDNTENSVLSHIMVEWPGSPAADAVADCIVSLTLQTFSTTSALRHSLIRSVRPKKKCEIPELQESYGGGVYCESVGTFPVNPMNKKRGREDVVGGDITEVEGLDLRDEIITKMKLGEVDPSVSLKNSLGDNNMEVEESKDNVLKYKNPQKLEILKQLINDSEFGKLFESIKSNADGDKLIFTGLPGTTYTPPNDEEWGQLQGETAVKAIDLKTVKKRGKGKSKSNGLEAFCYVLFSEDGTKIEVKEGNLGNEKLEHHAVVHCEDDGFRKTITFVLSKLASL